MASPAAQQADANIHIRHSRLVSRERERERDKKKNAEWTEKGRKEEEEKIDGGWRQIRQDRGKKIKMLVYNKGSSHRGFFMGAAVVIAAAAAAACRRHGALASRWRLSISCARRRHEAAGPLTVFAVCRLLDSLAAGPEAKKATGAFARECRAQVK